jgi:hypothetical protein
MSKLSNTYIKKMIALAQEKGVKLHFVCPPLKADYPTKFNHWKEARETTKREFQDVFEGYWKNIQFYPDSCFSDYAHFTNEYLAKNQKAICKEILPPEVFQQLRLNNYLPATSPQ